MLIYLLLFFFPALPAQAAGLQLQPTAIKVDVYDQIVQSKLVVSNPAKEIQLFEIYADDATDIIEINPQTFTLEAGARKEVLLKIKPQANTSIINTNLSVISHPFSIENFAINSAAKIPITINQLAMPPHPAKLAIWNLNYLLGIIILGLISYIIWLQRKTKKNLV